MPSPESLGLALVLVALFVKEAGVPVPVPGDLIVVGAGAAAGHNGLGSLSLVAIIMAATLGGLLQFLLVRGAARRPLLALLDRLGFPEARIEPLAVRLRRGGPRTLAVARATPGLRVVTIAASALAALPVVDFLVGLAVGNSAFIGFHFALGYAVGDAAPGLVAGIGPLALVLVALALVGVAGWWFRARGRGWRRRGRVGEGVVLASWADAACPACLALAAVSPRGLDSEATR